MKSQEVNIKDVAKKANVSVVTVSRVINNVPSVRQSNIEKVKEAMEELNYQPNAAARSLARGKTNIIGLIIPDLTDAFIMEVVGEVDRVLEENGYSLALSVVKDEEETDISNRSNFLFQQKRVDGILILTAVLEEYYIENLRKNKIPFVILDNQKLPYETPSIIVDNFKGGYDVTRYLIELGHQEIAFVGGPIKFLSSEKRAEGYQTALKEIGNQYISINRGKYDVSTGYNFVQEAVKNSALPTAIFASDDFIAFGVINALQEHRIKIPEEVSVVGFDNHPLGGKLKPYLTTVNQPASEMGRRGVGMLLADIENENLTNNSIIKLETELIIRDTTASPANF